jgi:hypothetical protein
MTIKNVCGECGKPVDPNNLGRGRSCYSWPGPEELVGFICASCCDEIQRYPSHPDDVGQTH